MLPKLRLDKLLVTRGLADSRERARALILAGKVEVSGFIATKSGTLVADSSPLRLREADHPYVSRGGLKLEHALTAFKLDPSDLVALDVGASTGGFTDALLQHGARRVYAVDVGYGQLAWKLRTDPRVVTLERQNIRHMDLETIPEPCDLATIDVSFISLTLVLDKVAALMQSPAGKPIVALVKPQFEVGRAQVGKGGVVREPAAREAALDKVRRFAREHGFEVGPHTQSPILGPAGNVEFLLLLRTPSARDTGPPLPPEAP